MAPGVNRVLTTRGFYGILGYAPPYAIEAVGERVDGKEGLEGRAWTYMLLFPLCFPVFIQEKLQS